MLVILTILVGIVFIALLVRGLIHTAIGLCQIALGLSLLAFSYTCDFISWSYQNIRYCWIVATQ